MSIAKGSSVVLIGVGPWKKKKLVFEKLKADGRERPIIFAHPTERRREGRGE